MINTSSLRDIERQSAEIIASIDFIRDNVGLKPFAADRATLRELLELVRSSRKEFIEFVHWHVPIYIGRCIIDELKGHWSIENQKRMAMFGKPYVDGFGNIGYENLYLPSLMLTSDEDIYRIEALWNQCRRANELRERFRKEFSSLSGQIASKNEIEKRCIDLGILPSTPMRFKVDRARVNQYSKELNITLINASLRV